MDELLKNVDLGTLKIESVEVKGGIIGLFNKTTVKRQYRVGAVV